MSEENGKTAESSPPVEAPEATASTPAPADPVAQLQADRDRIKDQLLRTAADFDNFRKRSRRDVDDAEKRGKEDTLRELLPIIDNLERAVSAAEGATDAKAVAEGVRMVLKMFDDAATRLGLSRIPTVGERFDPSLHDAIQQIETDDVPPGQIVNEIAAGYRIGERLVRPAMVVVARAPSNTSRPTH